MTHYRDNSVLRTERLTVMKPEDVIYSIDDRPLVEGILEYPRSELNLSVAQNWKEYLRSCRILIERNRVIKNNIESIWRSLRL